jgi:integrase
MSNMTLIFWSGRWDSNPRPQPWQYLREAEAERIVGKKGRPIKASTLAMDRSRIERHVKPLIGRRAIAGLTADDIAKMQADIAAGKTAKKRPQKGRTGETTGGRGVASRTVGMLATILAHARISNNPARGVKRFADGRNKLFLTLDEIGALGRVMREAEAEGRTRTGIAAIRALLLTGCRRHEILALPWGWLDAKARCIRFTDTKTGEQIRPLGAAAVEHLASQPTRGDYVFPADRGDGHFIGIARVLADLCDRAKLAKVSPHVLRHTFGSVAAELGFSELTIAGLLGHAARGVTQRYSHVPDSALLAAADRVSARIAAALDGRADAHVVPMRRKARA